MPPCGSPSPVPDSVEPSLPGRLRHRNDEPRPPSRSCLITHFPAFAVVAASRDAPEYASRKAGSRMDSNEDEKKMKIIIFSIKLDKFTGFFDKFPKGDSLVTDCNKRVILLNLSADHSDMAPKKVFRLPRICPQLPAFALAPHHAVEPSFLNRVRPSLPSRVEPFFPGRVRDIRNASPGL